MTNNPLLGLRILSTLVTVLLVVAVILVKQSFWVDFLIGAATGLSVVASLLAWSGEIQSGEERSPESPGLGLNQPQR
jgi:hypothetical protein